MILLSLIHISLEKMKGVHVKALTAFPCFLYSEESGQVENCPNLGTLLAAGEAAASRLGRRLHLNMPSCTQTQTISRIRRLGGDSAEPGSALIGTVPNNQDGSAVERIAAAYMSEVSHTQGERSYCYGGGGCRLPSCTYGPDYKGLYRCGNGQDAG